MMLEVVIVVNEIYLHARGLQGRHFDDELMVGIVDDDIHAGEADYFVELVAPFVDISVFGHERAHFVAFFEYGLRKDAGYVGQWRLREIGGDFLCYVQYFIVVHLCSGLMNF